MDIACGAADGQSSLTLLQMDHLQQRRRKRRLQVGRRQGQWKGGQAVAVASHGGAQGWSC